MALNQMEEVVLTLLAYKLSDLHQQEELQNFAYDQEGYNNSFFPKEPRLPRVSLKMLFDQYPTYDLTKKLIEFTLTVTGFLGSRVMGTGNGTYMGDPYADFRMHLLEQNGFVFASYNQGLIDAVTRGEGTPTQPMLSRFEQPTAFSLKINDIFVDFDFFPPRLHNKGLGEKFYSFTMMNRSNHRNLPASRQAQMTREDMNDMEDRRVMRDITMWATDQGMSVLKQLRHYRRKGMKTDNLLFQMELNVVNMPEPEKKEAEKEPQQGAQTAV